MAIADRNLWHILIVLCWRSVMVHILDVAIRRANKKTMKCVICFDYANDHSSVKSFHFVDTLFRWFNVELCFSLASSEMLWNFVKEAKHTHSQHLESISRLMSHGLVFFPSFRCAAWSLRVWSVARQNNWIRVRWVRSRRQYFGLN